MEPSPREVEAIRKDTDKWRLIASQILRFDLSGLPEKDINFLEDIGDEKRPDILSYRQAEWLLDIKDRATRVKQIKGYAVTTLLRICRENDFLFDIDTQDWLDKLHESGKTAVYLSEAIRLYHMAKRLDEI